MNTMTLKAAALLVAVALAPSAQAEPQHATAPTSDVIDRFNQAFMRHDASLLEGLVAEDCVMESVEGTRVVGRAANLTLWQNLANDKNGAFAVEDVVVLGDRANVRWRYHSGPGSTQYVRGVTLMRVRDGLIVEAIAYAKTGDSSLATAVRNAGSESR